LVLKISFNITAGILTGKDEWFVGERY